MYEVIYGSVSSGPYAKKRRYKTLSGARAYLRRARNEMKERRTHFRDVRYIAQLHRDIHLAEGCTVSVMSTGVCSYWIRKTQESE